MVIFIKKIKTKEGINTFDLEKVKKNIPAEYTVADNTPAISLTANHIMVGYKCELKKTKPVKASQPRRSSKPKRK